MAEEVLLDGKEGSVADPFCGVLLSPALGGVVVMGGGGFMSELELGGGVGLLWVDVEARGGSLSPPLGGGDVPVGGGVGGDVPVGGEVGGGGGGMAVVDPFEGSWFAVDSVPPVVFSQLDAVIDACVVDPEPPPVVKTEPSVPGFGSSKVDVCMVCVGPGGGGVGPAVVVSGGVGPGGSMIGGGLLPVYVLVDGLYDEEDDF